jgi:hypothetical protein
MGALTLSNTQIDLCDASGGWIGIRIHCVPQVFDCEHGLTGPMASLSPPGLYRREWLVATG